MIGLKLSETIKGWLTAGWEWLVNIAGNAWDWLTQTTWAEKIEDIKGWLTAGWEWLSEHSGKCLELAKPKLPGRRRLRTSKGGCSKARDWTINLAGKCLGMD